MLNLEHPTRLMIVAVCMMLFGCIMPFLMILKVVESTLFMNFLSFTLSTLGLFLGVVGIAVYQSKFKKGDNDRDDKNHWER